MKNRGRQCITILTAVVMLQMPLTSVSAAEQTDSERIENACTLYENWQATYVVQDTYVTDEVQYYIRYEEETYSGGNNSVPVTVSEAHGYGMLITVCMAEYDTNAQAIFDGMVRYYRAHLSDIGPNLMSWQQCDNGTALIDGADDGAMTGGTCDSASDGDMDIAYALLLADQVWGSTEEMPYRTLAVQMIRDIMEYEVNQTTWTVGLGDWIYGMQSGDLYYDAVRTSDFILSYMPIFAQVTDDNRWLNVYNSTNEILADMLDRYPTGLLPDFLILDENGDYQPAPENFLEDVTDGQYAYNSCRTPWRIGMDALYNDNDTAKSMAIAVSHFMQQATSGDPWEIMAGYTLDGTSTADYNDLCFVAPILIAAKCDDDTQWESALRTCIVDYGEDVYYGDTLRMLVMLIDANLWLVAKSDDVTISTTIGDINLDNSLTLADLVLLIQYLLGEQSLTETQAQYADCTEDNAIDGLDASRLRQLICASS